MLHLLFLDFPMFMSWTVFMVCDVISCFTQVLSPPVSVLPSTSPLCYFPFSFDCLFLPDCSHLSLVNLFFLVCKSLCSPLCLLVHHSPCCAFCPCFSQRGLGAWSLECQHKSGSKEGQAPSGMLKVTPAEQDETS